MESKTVTFLISQIKNTQIIRNSNLLFKYSYDHI